MIYFGGIFNGNKHLKLFSLSFKNLMIIWILSHLYPVYCEQYLQSIGFTRPKILTPLY